MSIKKLSVIPAVLALSACGGGGGGESSTIANASTNVYADEKGTAIQALNSGEKLSAKRATAAVLLDYEGGATELTDTDFSLKTNNNELTMILNNKEYSFTAQQRYEGPDGKVYGYRDHSEASGNERYIGLFSEQSELDAVLDVDNTSYTSIWNYYAVVQQADGTFSGAERGFAILGTETRPSALGQYTTKEFSGRMRAYRYDQSSFTSQQNYDNLRGDVALSADFEKQTINGQIKNITVQERRIDTANGDANLVEGDILLSAGTINGSVFSGDVSADETFTAAIDAESFNGTFNGGFFGPNAEEAAATFEVVNEQTDGSTSNIIGRFNTTTD